MKLPRIRLTREQIAARLQLEVAQDGRSPVARRYGVGDSYITAVIRGERPASARLAQAMGYERVMLYLRDSA